MKGFKEGYRELLELFSGYLKQEQEEGLQEIMVGDDDRGGKSLRTLISASGDVSHKGDLWERSPDLDKWRGKSKESKLEQLRRQCSSCQKCGLGKTRTRLVFGDGDPSSLIMFVGEAPGAEEDKRGIPFVGRAGQLFNRMLAAIQLKREEIYIANILKCRPPGNRDPLPEEIRVCLPWLEKQIEIIQPKIICALGRIAAHTLLQTKSSLSALRGRIHSYAGLKPFSTGDAELIVTYHPSALLRNENYKRPALEDLKLLRKEYKKYL